MLYVPRGRGAARQVSSEGTNRIASAFGTSVTPSTTSMSAATDVAVGSALTEDAHEVEVRISGTGADAASREVAVELRADRAGGTSWSTIVPAMLAGGAFGYDANPRQFIFPLFVPAGTTLAARAYGSVATACRVLVLTRGRPQRSEVSRAGSAVEAIGLSGRVGATLTMGTTTKGSWTLYGTTTRALWHWQQSLQLGSSDASWLNNGMHLDLGFSLDSGTTIQPLISDQVWNTTSGEQLIYLPSFAERWVPAGAQIYGRGQARSDSAPDAYSVVAYGTG